MQVDESLALVVPVAHSFHQFAQVRPSVRRECVPGVPQVVKVNRWKSGGLQRAEPDAAPEVAMTERQASRAREDG